MPMNENDPRITALSEWIDEQGWTRAQAAEALQCSRQLVSHVLNGRRPISRFMAEQIHQATEGRLTREFMLFGP